MKPVNGDLTKVRYAIGLPDASRRLLQNLEHSTKQIPGTHEVRKIMRYDTNAGRVRRGVPIFVTFSPDEKHNLLMLRLLRCRQNDPATLVDPVGQKMGERLQPELGLDLLELGVPIKDILGTIIPGYDDRRALLARDPLASVDGFRTLCLLAYKYLFGMRVCPACPDCNNKESGSGAPCQDIFGSNATPEGGVFERADGGFTSIEARKTAGSLHAHSQLHVQCLHQNTPLREIFNSVIPNNETLVQKYLDYKSHVCREVYADPEAWSARQEETEAAWPEYENAIDIVTSPAYLRSRCRLPEKDKESTKNASDNAWSPVPCRHHREPCHWTEHQDVCIDGGKRWITEYFHKHVQRLQELKQHHVHTLNAKGERVPLTHCRRPDNPKLCKSGFPRTQRIVDRAVVLCHGLLQKFDMPASGRRNMIGAMHGPVNDGNLNGTHPALLAVPSGGACNSDVQLPYRFPICAATHVSDEYCTQRCWMSVNSEAIIEAAQIAQDAQAGYACDYQNKRGPRAFHEIKECRKGHHQLAQHTASKDRSYIGKRHVTRLCSDAYGKGVVRSMQDCRMSPKA